MTLLLDGAELPGLSPGHRPARGNPGDPTFRCESHSAAGAPRALPSAEGEGERDTLITHSANLKDSLGVGRGRAHGAVGVGRALVLDSAVLSCSLGLAEWTAETV